MTTPEILADLLSQCIRVGMVTARNPQNMTVQVECPDTVSGPLVSAWLQVLTPRAKEDRQYDLPDVGDQVLCLFLPNGLEQGFVLGCMYASATTGAPPVTSGDKWHRKFKDGTTVEYDRQRHKMTILVMGDAELSVTKNLVIKAGGNISMNAAHISLQE